MSSPPGGPSDRPLSLEEYERYGRQMILPSCGLAGQVALKKAVVGVVGAGGLGCPVLQYLAGAGVGTAGVIVGTIHIFDHDVVSVSNLHRQVLHTTDRVGMNKADSAKLAMLALNPLITVQTHPEPVLPSTALSLLAPVDIVVDCTDRPLTRYLLNDAAVRLGKPLVSGAAIAGAGQWAVYGGSIPPPATASHGSTSSHGIQYDHGISGEGGGSDRKGKKRACYRCIWPSVLPGSHGRCEDLGVWGFVTGLVGTGMASEVVKLITGNADPEPLLHLYHLGRNPLLRSIRLKPPSPKCIACGPNSLLKEDLTSMDYEEFCGGGPEVNESTGARDGNEGERISAKELHNLLETRPPEKVLMVDTRSPTEFEICAIPESTSESIIPLTLALMLGARKALKADIPLAAILKDPSSLLSNANHHNGSADSVERPNEVVFVCKLGNDSQVAAAALRKALGESDLRIRDLRGGLRSWSRNVDPTFPMY